MRDFIFFTTDEWVFLASVLTATCVVVLLRHYWSRIAKALTFLDLSDANTLVRVSFDDNFHNFNASERYSIRYSGGSGGASRAAKRAINDDLRGMLDGNGCISGEELFKLWCAFGETPSVDGMYFDAYGYARRRANFYAWRKRIFLF